VRGARTKEGGRADRHARSLGYDGEAWTRSFHAFVEGAAALFCVSRSFNKLNTRRKVPPFAPPPSPALNLVLTPAPRRPQPLLPYSPVRLDAVQPSTISLSSSQP
jgi:flagellar motor protein MotB